MNLAAFQSAQRAYDNQADPALEDDEELVHDECSALDQATEDVLATPGCWAWFIDQTVTDINPVQVFYREEDFFPYDMRVDQLLAIVLASHDWDLVREARSALRDRFLAHDATQQVLQDRAAELVGEPV